MWLCRPHRDCRPLYILSAHADVACLLTVWMIVLSMFVTCALSLLCALSGCIVLVVVGTGVPLDRSWECPPVFGVAAVVVVLICVAIYLCVPMLVDQLGSSHQPSAGTVLHVLRSLSLLVAIV